MSQSNQSENVEKTVRDWAQLEHSLLHAVVSIQRSFIGDYDIQDAFGQILEELLRLTGSEYGFIGETLYDPEPYLLTHALTDVSWDEETSKLYKENMAKGFEFRNLNTLFGVSLITKQTVISNSPKDDPRSGGLPHGHPGMNSYAGIPILREGRLLGLIGLANRPGGYESDLIGRLDPVIITCGTMIEAVRQHYETSQLTSELVTKKQLLDAILLNVKDGIIVMDYMFNIELANSSASLLLNKEFDDITGAKLTELLDSEASESIQASIQKFLLLGTSDALLATFETEITGETLATKHIEIGISELKLGNRKLFVLNLHDISARIAQQSSLEAMNTTLRQLSETDGLTKLANRRQFDNAMTTSFRNARRLGLHLFVAIIDLDFFKNYNDHYGHPAGDEVLVSLASIFESQLQREVESCARIGGEEFAIIMMGCSQQHFETRLKSIADKLEACGIEHQSSQLKRVTISVGCARLTDLMTTPNELYEAADKALYQAKANGRNQVSWLTENDESSTAG